MGSLPIYLPPVKKTDKPITLKQPKGLPKPKGQSVPLLGNDGLIPGGGIIPSDAVTLTADSLGGPVSPPTPEDSRWTSDPLGGKWTVMTWQEFLGSLGIKIPGVTKDPPTPETDDGTGGTFQEKVQSLGVDTIAVIVGLVIVIIGVFAFIQSFGKGS